MWSGDSSTRGLKAICKISRHSHNEVNSQILLLSSSIFSAECPVIVDISES